MSIRLATAVVLAASVVGSAAVAAPCTAGNTAGVWSLASIRAAEPGVEEFYARAPHEWTRLSADGGYVYVASNRPIDGLAAINASLNRADLMDPATYSTNWSRPGQMLILRDGQPFQLFRCEILDEAVADARAGDMILSAAEGMPMLRRVQRRVTR